MPRADELRRGPVQTPAKNLAARRESPAEKKMSLLNDKVILLTCFIIALFFLFQKKTKSTFVDPTANNERAILDDEPIGSSRLGFSMLYLHEKDEFI